MFHAEFGPVTAHIASRHCNGTATATVKSQRRSLTDHRRKDPALAFVVVVRAGSAISISPPPSNLAAHSLLQHILCPENPDADERWRAGTNERTHRDKCPSSGLLRNPQSLQGSPEKATTQVGASSTESSILGKSLCPSWLALGFCVSH